MNGVQVYLYTSMLRRPADGQQSPLPISGYTFCPRPPLPFTLLPYPSTLYYSPHPFRTPRSYTQSPTSPSALFRTLATPLLRMPRKCRYLRTAVKSKKERAIARCLFSMPEDPYGGSCNPAHGQSSTGQLAWARYTSRVL